MMNDGDIDRSMAGDILKRKFDKLFYFEEEKEYKEDITAKELEQDKMDAERADAVSHFNS